MPGTSFLKQLPLKIVKLLVALAWLLAPNRLFAQGGVTVHFLAETADQNAITEVVVSIKKKGAAAAESMSRPAAFSLVLDTAGLEYLSCFALGYTIEKISKAQLLTFIKQNPAGTYKITLKRKKIELNEVTVKPEATEPFFQRQNIMVADYCILPNGSLLLVGDGQIYLVSKNDSLIDAIENRRHVDSIILDCTGKLYLKNRTQLFPAHIRNGSRILVSDRPLPANEVLGLLLEIKACNKDFRLKERVGAFNQQIAYVLEMSAKPHAAYLFYNSQNTERLKLAASEKLALETDGAPDRMGEITWQQNRLVKDHMHRTWVYEYYILKKLYSPAFILRDTIYIFDHTSKKISVFNYKLGNTSLEFFTLHYDTITYVDKPGWKNEVLLDPHTGRFYALLQDDGVALSPIAIGGRNGGETIRLPKKHYYADKVKVYNNCFYYLWKDPEKTGANKTLYKFEVK